MVVARFVLLALCAFALVVQAAPMQAAGGYEVQVERLEATDPGTATGTLAGLLLEHLLDDQPVDPRFLLDAEEATVVAHRALVKVSGANSGSEVQLVSSGPARMGGIEARSEARFFVVPLDNAPAPAVEVARGGCMGAIEPESDQDVRALKMPVDEQDVVADTSRAAHVDSCDDLALQVHGDFSVILWEWDMNLNGDRVNSGVEDPGRDAGIGTGAGSAQEIVVTAHNATLTMTIRTDAADLYVNRLDVEAQHLSLTAAHGTLPGLLGRVDGDVDLVGDYSATLAAHGDDFTFAVVGTTTQATSPA